MTNEELEQTKMVQENPEIALNVLEQALENIVVSRRDHRLINHAFATLQKLTKPKEVKKDK